MVKSYHRPESLSITADEINKYRAVFNNSMIGLYQTTPDGKIVMANPALIKMLGYESFDELKDRNLEKEGYEPEYDRRTFKEKIVLDGRVIGLESVWRKKDGTRVHVRESAVALYSKSGEIDYYFGTVEDITDRVIAEDARREIEEKYRSLAEYSPLAIMIVTDGIIQYINPAGLEIAGLKEPRDIIGRNLFDFIPEETKSVA